LWLITVFCVGSGLAPPRFITNAGYLCPVDDGSTDATASIVKIMATTVSEIQLLRAPLRRGKGAAVRRRKQAAIGRLQLFTDADGATPVQELARLEQAVANRADVAIGSRSLASRLPNYAVHARWYRTIVSNLFIHSYDRRALEESPTRNADSNFSITLWQQTSLGVSSIDGYGFDLELLLCGATMRIPHRRNSGELVPSTNLKISHPQRRARHAAGISRDPTE
jgi:glycosyltransferase involved in cell wall biosynthesis